MNPYNIDAIVYQLCCGSAVVTAVIFLIASFIGRMLSGNVTGDGENRGRYFRE